MSELQKLYNQDLNLWREQTAIAIKNRDYHNMDWDNLLEEIIDIWASERRALKSYTKRLIDHILKLKYWNSEQEYNQKGWRKEVVSCREEIKEILEESPSLKNYLSENYRIWYHKSVKAMRQEFSIPDDSFISLETIMHDSYFG